MVALGQTLQLLLIQREVMLLLEEHKPQQFLLEEMEINNKQRIGTELLGQMAQVVLIQFTTASDLGLKQLYI